MGVCLVAFNLVSLGMIFMSATSGLLRMAAESDDLRMTYADGRPLSLQPPKAADGYHLFLSHVWQHGQDQASTVKSMLRLLVPQINCFLDVDNLTSIKLLETYVQKSDLVLVLLTQGYVRSKNCRRELLAAVQAGKPLLVLRETDIDSHGGVTVDMVREELKLLIDEQAADLAHAEVEAMCQLLDSSEIVDYHREKCFKYAGAPPQSAPSPQRASSVCRSRARPAAEQRCNGSSS